MGPTPDSRGSDEKLKPRVLSISPTPRKGNPKSKVSSKSLLGFHSGHELVEPIHSGMKSPPSGKVERVVVEASDVISGLRLAETRSSGTDMGKRSA